MSGLMNLVSRFARGRGGAVGRSAPGTRPTGGMSGTGAGTAGGARRGGQGSMVEGALRRFLRRR